MTFFRSVVTHKAALSSFVRTPWSTFGSKSGGCPRCGVAGQSGGIYPLAGHGPPCGCTCRCSHHSGWVACCPSLCPALCVSNGLVFARRRVNGSVSRWFHLAFHSRWGPRHRLFICFSPAGIPFLRDSCSCRSLGFSMRFSFLSPFSSMTAEEMSSFSARSVAPLSPSWAHAV